jgi:hypothetical protein
VIRCSTPREQDEAKHREEKKGDVFHRWRGKTKLDLTVGIAMGSIIQIALFIAPVLVWCWRADSSRRSRWNCRSVERKRDAVWERLDWCERGRRRSIQRV